ncbi:MAG: YtxH domain-containing protein [Proteobacteria bacterium]|nr:YtxH domain-containing protein [Pseudomonadota bacterium]
MGIFDKLSQLKKATGAPKADATKNSASTAAAPKTAEMAFSEALNAKSGSAAVAALEKAQPEERKSIAANTTLMSTMKKSLDKKSQKQCEKYLPTKKSSGNPLSGAWNAIKGKGSNLLSDAADWWDDAKDSASDFLNDAKDTATDFVNGAKEKASEFVSDAKDTATELWNGAKEKATGIYNDAKENVIDPAIDSAKAFIPQKVSNDTVVGFYDVMSRFSNTLSKKDIKQHHSDNEKTINMDKDGNSQILGLDKDNRYIENQDDLESIKYGKGKSNMSYSGCEIIATFNALRAIGEGEKLEDLIEAYENDGMTLNGQFGTAPGAILGYFQKKGYPCEMISEFSPEILAEFSKKYETFIATVYNNENDITSMIHTVSITKDKNEGSDDTFSVHNAYAWSDNTKDSRRSHFKVTSGQKYVALQGYTSIEEAIANISSSSVKPITLIGINKQISGD